MVQVTFIEPDGKRRDVSAEAGASLMACGLAAGVDGIVGLCGGFANCGTCHVFVDPAWLPLLPAIDEAEDAMLDGTMAERQPNSRLACQLIIEAAWDGIILTVPPTQA